MPDAGITPPYLDPSQYPDYLDAQRKQMVAGMLMNSLQQGSPTPPDWDSMKVVPKRGLMQNIAPLVTALMANKAMGSSQQAQQKYYSGLYGGSQPQSAGSTPPSPSPDGSAPPAGGSGAPPINQPQQPQSPQSGRNPMLLTGEPRTSQMLLSLMGQQEYGKALAGQYAPTDMQKMLRAAGIDPGSPQGQAALQQAASKANYIAPVDVRPGGTLVDPRTQQPTFTAPANGVQTQWTPQGPQQTPVPGAIPAQAAMTGATKGAQEANTPHYEPDPLHPGQFNVSYPPTPPALQTSGAPPSGAATPAVPRGTMPQASNAPTAADLEGMKAGAQSGVAYASELSKNATGATEVRRSLSELKNLASQTSPSALNEGKMKLGQYMIASGVSPESTAQWLGVDVGALQAAQKQTSTLAVNTIHSMTSRGTNFDLDTFMRNNPSLNMADPAAFNRVVDYMDQKSQQEIAKQKDFAQWKRGKPPDEWETGHTAHWLDQQNQLINAGRGNSRPPLSSFVRP